MEGAADHSKFEQQLNIERNCGMDVKQASKQIRPYLEQRNEVCKAYVRETDEEKLRIMKDIIDFYDNCILQLLNISSLK